MNSPSKIPGAKALQLSNIQLSTSQLSLVLTQAESASYRYAHPIYHGIYVIHPPQQLSITNLNHCFIFSLRCFGLPFSWEVGTHQTALLELNAPTVFLYNGSQTIPPFLTSDTLVSDVFASVDKVLAAKPSGILPFFSDKAIGDPASRLQEYLHRFSRFSHRNPTFVEPARCRYRLSHPELDDGWCDRLHELLCGRLRPAKILARGRSPGIQRCNFAASPTRTGPSLGRFQWHGSCIY